MTTISRRTNPKIVPYGIANTKMVATRINVKTLLVRQELVHHRHDEERRQERAQDVAECSLLFHHQTGEPAY